MLTWRGEKDDRSQVQLSKIVRAFARKRLHSNTFDLPEVQKYWKLRLYSIINYEKPYLCSQQLWSVHPWRSYSKCTDHPCKMYHYVSDFCKLHHQPGCKKNEMFILCFVHSYKLIIPSSPLNGLINPYKSQAVRLWTFEGAEIVEDTVSDIKLVATWKILPFWIASNAFDISDIH